MNRKKIFVFLLALSSSCIAFGAAILNSFSVDTGEKRNEFNVKPLTKNKNKIYRFKFTFQSEDRKANMYILKTSPFKDIFNTELPQGWTYSNRECVSLGEFVSLKDCVLELEYDPSEADTSGTHQFSIKYAYQSQKPEESARKEIIIKY